MGSERVSRFTLRKLSVKDIPAGLRLCHESGWNQLEDDWRVFLNSTGSGGFLARKEGRVVGTVAFLCYDVFAWIAMMLVDPQERRSGIGTELMRQALFALKDAACVGLDATPAGESLYRRFGFVNDYHLVRAKATIDTARLEMSAGSARKMNAEDFPAVLRRDREVFGADRGKLLASLFARAPECSWIARYGAEVRGYAFGRPGHLYHHLGPIVAEDIGTARALVTHCCSELNGRQLAIDAAELHRDWLNWLRSVGFVEERPFVRMFRRGDRHPGMPAQQYAITGPEFA
jgi:predicted N-acetyltransferase YhbS